LMDAYEALMGEGALILRDGLVSLADREPDQGP